MKIKHAIACIENGVRAVSRFFSDGFGNIGRMYYGDFFSFTLLDDRDFGALKYTETKKPLSESYKALRSYSLRFFYIQFFTKSKIIYSSERSDWVFTVNSVKVFSLNRKYFFAKIGNEIFALTGTTSTHYQIPNYFSSNKLKPRHHALYLLEEAKLLK